MKIKKLAIIGGSGLKNFKKEEVIFLQRHGNNLPPHKIDHKKNVLSLKEKGVDAIIGICSVGSLKPGIKPGTIVMPDDYIDILNKLTFFETEAVHIVPELDEKLRQMIIKTIKKLKLTVQGKGIYFQTRGPRFETRAEINMIKDYADVVGMTMASEATLAKEQGMCYASICIVDNYPNGIADKKLKVKDWQNAQEKNKKNVLKLLDVIFS